MQHLCCATLLEETRQSQVRPGQGLYGRQPRTRNNTNNFGDSEKAQPTLHPGVRAPDGLAFPYLSELTSFRSPWLRRYLMRGTSACMDKQSPERSASLLCFCSVEAQPLPAAQARLCFRVARSDQSHQSKRH